MSSCKGDIIKTLDYIFPNLPDGLDANKLDTSRLPKHVAVIMDGNGRWAKKRGNKRLDGHRAGVEAVRECIRTASDLGIRFLTIYSFSSENWKRPLEEVRGLMNLFATTLLAEVDELDKENVRITTIGDLSSLPKKTREAFESAWEQTKNNTGMTLVVAVNYGARAEIITATQAYAAQCMQARDEGMPMPQLDEETFATLLETSDIPDPELLIRTSGEMRISNFLLWQIAYTEIVVTPVLWPDFNRYEFLRALLEYQGRDRRFGGVK